MLQVGPLAPDGAAPAAQVPAAAAPAADDAVRPTGPRDTASSRAGKARRQYCWWITLSYPLPETVERLGLKTPDDFTREQWLEIVRSAHDQARVQLEEVDVSLEQHMRTDGAGRRLPHLNALCRSSRQYAWSGVASALFRNAKVRVDFFENIKTWYDGVVYGTVSSASDHKPQEELDATPLQWAAAGSPIPFLEVLPAKWHKQGRQPKLSRLQFLDAVRKHNLTTELEVFPSAWSQPKERGG